jgi:broad specificity phosphatase PhoE
MPDQQIDAHTGVQPDPAPSDGAVTVLVLRHGQSEWNAVHRWQGVADSPLTDLGRSQAIETAWTLAGFDVTFSSIWSSDLSRARETAAIIGDALALGAPTLEPRLREAHAGEWEGLTPDEIEIGWPGWLEQHHRPPSFEPFDAVVSRTVAALQHIAGRTIAAAAGQAPAALVVAHSGVIRSLIRHLGRHDDRVPNLGGIWLTIDALAAADSAAGRSPIAEPDHGITLLDLFDPAGIVISGIDAPGEDPGEQADQADAHGGSQH